MGRVLEGTRGLQNSELEPHSFSALEPHHGTGWPAPARSWGAGPTTPIDRVQAVLAKGSYARACANLLASVTPVSVGLTDPTVGKID
jgi:hypothetical protein